MTHPTLYRTVKCSERLPENPGWYNCFKEDQKFLGAAYFVNGKFETTEITHWLESISTDADVSDDACREITNRYFYSDREEKEWNAYYEGLKQMRDLLAAKMEAMKQSQGNDALTVLMQQLAQQTNPDKAWLTFEAHGMKYKLTLEIQQP